MKMTAKVTLMLTLLLWMCSMVAAQSTEMDRPTKMTSREASVEFGPPPVTHYYTFEAGPGEFSILMAVGGPGQNGCSWGILDSNYKQVGGETLWALDNEEQKIDRFTLKKKDKVLIKVACEGGHPAKYHFRLSGAVDLPDASNK